MRPGAIVLVGLPGSGKSTLARALARLLNDGRIIDKDVVRHALFAPADYTAAERGIAFSAMLDAARYHLGRNRFVIFDGLTFSRRQEVAAVEEMADEGGWYVAVIVCDVSVAEAIRRCQVDSSAGTHLAVNRDADLVRRVAAEMEEPAMDYLTLDTTADVDSLAADALAYVIDEAGRAS